MNEENKEIRFSDAGEELIGQAWKVLDKGYLRLVSYHGTDQLIEAAARVSYKKGTRSVTNTKNLIRYLYRHSHHSPFEMPSCIFEWKAPLFVIQQLLRHRTAKLNQESHRYSEVSNDKYCIDKEEWRVQSKKNKQGSDIPGDDWIYNCGLLLTNEQDHLHKNSDDVYANRLNSGVSRELARKDIPHSTYSTLYWQIDLRNLLHFLSLRCEEHAQLEIRVYANLIAAIVKELFPITFEAWKEYQLESVKFSQKELFLLRELCKYNMSWEENSLWLKEQADELGLSNRELQEFLSKTENKQYRFNLEDYEIIKEENEK
jgi:thymidylate synthase (FAD)